ncbi:MAG: hypothetical protein WCT37_04325 [Patescibacteria group bacterium]|jgi:hypothetical protein
MKLPELSQRRLKTIRKIRKKGAKFQDQRSAIMDLFDLLFNNEGVVMNAEENKFFREKVIRGLSIYSDELTRIAGKMLKIMMQNEPFSFLEIELPGLNLGFVNDEAEKLASYKGHIGPGYLDKQEADWQVMSVKIADCLQILLGVIYPVKHRKPK